MVSQERSQVRSLMIVDGSRVPEMSISETHANKSLVRDIRIYHSISTRVMVFHSLWPGKNNQTE